MKLKNKFMALGLSVLSVMAVSSCSDFLDEGPKTALTEEEIYSDTTNIESNLTKLYTNWKQAVQRPFSLGMHGRHGRNTVRRLSGS